LNSSSSTLEETVFQATYGNHMVHGKVRNKQHFPFTVSCYKRFIF